MTCSRAYLCYGSLNAFPYYTHNENILYTSITHQLQVEIQSIVRINYSYLVKTVQRTFCNSGGTDIPVYLIITI